MAKTKKTAEAEAAQVTETTQPAETAAEEKPQFTFSAAPAELQYDYKTRNKVAKFRKVSYEQWKADMLKCGLYLPEKKMQAAYDAIVNEFVQERKNAYNSVNVLQQQLPEGTLTVLLPGSFSGLEPFAVQFELGSSLQGHIARIEKQIDQGIVHFRGGLRCGFRQYTDTHCQRQQRGGHTYDQFLHNLFYAPSVL